jgi:hypothetical protein
VRAIKCVGAGGGDRAAVESNSGVEQNKQLFERLQELGSELTKLTIVMSTGQLPSTAQATTKMILKPPFSAVFKLEQASAPPPHGAAAQAAKAAEEKSAV